MSYTNFSERLYSASHRKKVGIISPEKNPLLW